MPAALINLLLLSALVLCLVAGAVLALGGSVTAVMVDGADARGVRISAVACATLGFLLFVSAMTATITVAPLA